MTLSFALGAFALSSALGAITYFTTRSSILDQAQSSIVSTVFANAASLQPSLGDFSTAINALSTIDKGSESESALYLDGQWHFIHPTLATPSSIPDALRVTAIGGVPASQIFRLDGATVIGVAVPIPVEKATYFEVFSLAQTERTLQIILASLVAGGVARTLAGTVLG